MRNFIIFFQEKEGSSPIIRTLDKHPSISVVRTTARGVGGWEPFDTFNCGSLSLQDLRFYLDGIFSRTKINIDDVNSRYMRTGRDPLKRPELNAARGFKMRYKSPADWPGLGARSRVRQKQWFKVTSYILKKLQFFSFKKAILEQISRQEVVVFVLVRQDIFRWALSRYHGDGTGKRGHLQFRLASGKISHDDIAKIWIEPGRFRRIIKACQRSHRRKRRLIQRLKLSGVDVYPIFYEDFVEDKTKFFQLLLERLEVGSTPDAIAEMLSRGTSFKKVHSDDISTFVVNHKEITKGFGHYQYPWEGSFAYQEAE